MNPQITRFIEKQTCASVCCSDEEGNPYCFSCFYGFNSKEGLLYFKSSASSKHSKIISQKPVIAGTILPDKLNVLQVKGIQFWGIVLANDHILAKKASQFFHKQHPMALAIPGEVWTIQITEIKMTDNNIGFGKKTCWSREELIV